MPREIFEALEHLLQSDERFVVAAENFDLMLYTPAGKRLGFRPIPQAADDDLPHDARVQAVHLRLTQRVNETHSLHVALEEAAEEIVDLQDELAAKEPSR